MKGTCNRAVISLRRPAISCVSAGLSITHGPAMRRNRWSAPTSCPAICMMAACAAREERQRPSGARRLWQLRRALCARGTDEAGEQRVPVTRRGGELGVKLSRYEPGVVGELDHLHQPIAREPGEAHASLAIAIEIVVVELVAMPMALHDEIAPVNLAGARAGTEQHLLRPEAHGAALVGALIAHLRAVHLILPLGNERNDRVGRGAVELGAVGVAEAERVAAELDDRHLHAEADPEVGHAVLARVAYRLDLALDAALAETARHQNRIHVLQP